MQKKRGPKPINEVNKTDGAKSIGLFDHIKHIQNVQSPDYYTKLSEADRKTFSIFMILKGLSMNPAFVECAACLYRYMEIIPGAQFYKILIDLYPRHGYKEYHKWVKSSRDKSDSNAKKELEVVNFIMKKYEISMKEARVYLQVFRSTKSGKNELLDIVTGFGISEKEAGEMI